MGKMPRVGEAEKNLGPNGPSNIPSGTRYKHKMEQAPKEADKFRDDYYVRKKRVAEAKEKRVGKFKDGAGSRKEVKGSEDVRKARKVKERLKAKNARPAKRGGKR